jgi:hypothetical protein
VWSAFYTFEAGATRDIRAAWTATGG